MGHLSAVGGNPVLAFAINEAPLKGAADRTVLRRHKMATRASSPGSSAGGGRRGNSHAFRNGRAFGLGTRERFNIGRSTQQEEVVFCLLGGHPALDQHLPLEA